MVPIIPVSEYARKSVIDDIILTGHRVIVLGKTDTGKSVFCRQLAYHAMEKGLKVAIVDSDVGQSWIGPPTTIGLKFLVDKPLPTLFPDSFYFVGSVTPEKHLLQCVVGTKLMVECAESSKADLIIIDTTGLINKPIGRVLKQSKIDLIRPDHIVCFQRESELEILIKGCELDSCHIHRLSPSKYAEKKSLKYRSKYRNEQFAKYFGDSITHSIGFSQLKSQRDCFLNGRFANHQELVNISNIIDMDVLYAEFFFRGMFLVIDKRLDWLTEKKLASQLKIEDLIIKIPDDYNNLLIALINENNEPICLGIIENIDFNNRIIDIKSKKGSLEFARAIQFGDFRLPRDGI